MDVIGMLTLEISEANSARRPRSVCARLCAVEEIVMSAPFRQTAKSMVNRLAAVSLLSSLICVVRRPSFRSLLGSPRLFPSSMYLFAFRKNILKCAAKKKNWGGQSCATIVSSSDARLASFPPLSTGPPDFNVMNHLTTHEIKKPTAKTHTTGWQQRRGRQHVSRL